MNHNGRNVFITGSNRGLGLSLLNQFHSMGANVIAHVRKQSDSEELRNNFKNNPTGSTFHSIYFDLKSIPSSREIQEKLGNEFKIIDVLVVNAGIYNEQLFQMSSDSILEELFEVNLFSAIKIVRKLIPNLRKSKNPSIIFISSIASMDLEIGNSLYGITKAALNALTKSLYKELSPYNIRVNAVAPGLIDTDMSKKINAKAYRKALEKTILNEPISPEDIANVVLFLASEDSKVINGEIIRCDGGRI